MTITQSLGEDESLLWTLKENVFVQNTVKTGTPVKFLMNAII